MVCSTAFTHEEDALVIVSVVVLAALPTPKMLLPRANAAPSYRAGIVVVVVVVVFVAGASFLAAERDRPLDVVHSRLLLLPVGFSSLPEQGVRAAATGGRTGGAAGTSRVPTQVGRAAAAGRKKSAAQVLRVRFLRQPAEVHHAGRALGGEGAHALLLGRLSSVKEEGEKAEEPEKPTDKSLLNQSPARREREREKKTRANAEEAM